MIPILILAAGTSSRMRGSDKLLEDVDGEPLLRKQTRVALATGQPVFVALAPDTPERLAAIAGMVATPMIVPEAAEGLSGTLRGAVVQLPKSDAVMIMLGDLVALTTQDLQDVLDARIAHPDYLVWRGATDAGQPGHPIVIDQSLRQEFAKLQGDLGGDSILRPLRDQTYLVTLAGKRARLDLDTPEDWAAWRASAS